MILVSGAGGKTGVAIVRELSRRAQPVRAWVRRSECENELRALGATECVVGDMRVAADWARAVENVRAIYHVCPNLMPDEYAIGLLALGAAQRGQVEHFVYHSVLHPQIESMPHHWHKLRVEEAVFASGLPFSILQPSAYMQNVLAMWPEIVSQGEYETPYAAETRLGMVDLLDVAEAAAVVLTQPGHIGGIYEVATSEMLTQVQIAQVLAAGLGRAVRAHALPRDEWRARAQRNGLNNYQLEALAAMFGYYERHGFYGNGHVLRSLLHREPSSFAEFVTRQVGVAGMGRQTR